VRQIRHRHQDLSGRRKTPRPGPGPRTRATTSTPARCSDWIPTTGKSKKPNTGPAKRFLGWGRGGGADADRCNGMSSFKLIIRADAISGCWEARRKDKLCAGWALRSNRRLESIEPETGKTIASPAHKPASVSGSSLPVIVGRQGLARRRRAL